MSAFAVCLTVLDMKCPAPYGAGLFYCYSFSYVRPASNILFFRNMISFSCIYCGKKLRVEQNLAHKKAKCPACGHLIFIPPKVSSDTQKTGGEQKTQNNGQPAVNWQQKSDRQIAEMLLSEPFDKEEKEKLALKRSFSAFIPRYDDLTLFALSITFLSLLLINPEVKNDLIKILTNRFDLRITIAVILSAIGMIFSFFNIFFKREKFEFEKYLMLFFAVFVTAGTGIYAGYIMLSDNRSWLIIFPAWNIINAAFLLLMFRLKIVDTDCITEERASFVQVILCLISIAIVLAICHYIFKLRWPFTYSICVCFVMSLHKSLQDIFGRSTVTELITDDS